MEKTEWNKNPLHSVTKYLTIFNKKWRKVPEIEILDYWFTTDLLFERKNLDKLMTKNT